MAEHDPHAFLSGLSKRLASRSRHVNVFLGAGSSKASGLPDVAGLEGAINAGLVGAEKAAFDRMLIGRSLEGVLSRLRRITALVGEGDTVDGLTAGEAKALDQSVCRIIIEALGANPTPTPGPSKAFASWLQGADYVRPVEVFTVNYDLVIERALDEIAAPYFDGFAGTLTGRFRADLVDADPSDRAAMPAFFTRVWKLHGSLNWSYRDDGEVVRLSDAVKDGMPAAIYPSDAKYDESRRVPFVVLQDRFRRALNESESLTLVAGYSWGDEHLNDQLLDAALRRTRSETVVFCYSSIPAELAEKATTTPNLQVVGPSEAIRGGSRGNWSEPSVPLPEYVWKDSKIRLGDFGSLSTFLARASRLMDADE